VRVELQPAYVLHSRPYRDTSLLLDLLTPDWGRLSAVAKGVRRGKSQRRPLLNPFIPLLVSFQGRSNLQTLTGVEAEGPGHGLQGLALYSGFYLNELLVRLVGEWDANPAIYNDYRKVLCRLAQLGSQRAGADDPQSDFPKSDSPEPILRLFEWNLLSHLGYGIDFVREAQTGAAIEPDSLYQFDPEAGFIGPLARERQDPDSMARAGLFRGEDLLACDREDFSRPPTRVAAKRLSRLMLQPLLGARPLKSRELFK